MSLSNGCIVGFGCRVFNLRSAELRPDRQVSAGIYRHPTPETRDPHPAARWQKLVAEDPRNELLGRMRRQRLDGEPFGLLDASWAQQASEAFWVERICLFASVLKPGGAEYSRLHTSYLENSQ